MAMDDPNALNENGLSAEDQEAVNQTFATAPTGATPSAPGAFAGAWKGLAGIPHAAATIGLQAFGDVSARVRGAVDEITGAHDFSNLAGLPEGYGAGTPFKAAPDTVRSWVDENADETAQQIADLQSSVDETYRPDPHTTGAVGQQLFGLADTLTRVGLGTILTRGTAGTEVAAGSIGQERTQDLEAQGVDPGTAAESGALSAASFEAMGAAGGEGGSLASRMLKSMGANVGADLGNRAADSEVLRNAGYGDLASQEQWNDARSIMADAIIGAAFPLVHEGYTHLADASATRAEAKLADNITANPDLFDRLRTNSGYVPAANVDAALTALNGQHATDTAPGIPTDPQSQGLHLKALDAAIKQVANGDDVYVDPIVRGMHTIPRPVTEGAQEGIQAALFGAADDSVTIADVDGMVARGEIGEDVANRMKEFLSHAEDSSNAIGTPHQDYATAGGTIPEPGWLDSTVARGDDGQPLTLYRGSRDGTTGAETFKALGASTGHPTAHLGVFFSDDQADASRYGKVGSYHLDIRNPKRYDIADLPALDDAEEAATLRKQIESEGHDGILLDARPYGGPVQYIAFGPEQVIGAHAREDEQAGGADTGMVRAQPAENLNGSAGGVSASGAPGEPLHPWTPVDDSVSVPYAGGVSDDGRTVYLDKRMPDTVDVDGKTIDAKEAVVLHERTEWPLMHLTGPMDDAQIDALKARIGDDGTVPEKSIEKLRAGEPLTYAEAHQIATFTENHFVREKYGIDPEKYQNALKEAIAKAYREAPHEGDIPADLDEKPYANIGETALLQNATKEIPDGAAGTDEGTVPSIGRLDPVRDSEVAQARAAANAAPDTIIGGDVTTGAAMKSADEDVAEARRLAKGIHAAVACFLRFGGDV